MRAQLALPTMRMAALALLAACLGACSSVLLPPTVEPVVSPSQSVEQADIKLAQVARERAAIEAAYAASEQLCYAKFFVNNCLDAAREKRRSGLAVLRAIEIEAGHFKRKAVVEERDRALAEAEKEYAAQDAQLAAQPPKPPRAAGEEAPPRPAARPVDRVAEHAAKMNRIAAQERAATAKRAAKAAAFEKKRLESERRQREVAARKAEKAAKDQAR
jgi:colicin import membrane protein